jgi:hypothetical protein
MRNKALLYGLILLFLASPTWALTKKISGTTNVEDSYIAVGANANNNYGGNAYIWLIPAAQYGYIRVKNVASELGANATISACVCSLYNGYEDTPGDCVARRVFKPWVEGDEDGVNDDDGDVTWNDWASDDMEWNGLGGTNSDDEGEDNSSDGFGADRKATAEDTEAISGIGWDAITISAALAQAWYDGTAVENGVQLVTTDGNYAFHSTENASNQPFFVFTYTTGEPPAAGQVIIIGARYEEDSHNPRYGIPPVAWK